MQAFELRNLSEEELAARLDEMKQELFTLRFQRESGQLEDMSRIRKTRREVARIMTVIRERELAAGLVAQEDTGE
jgi:large subunit ribosomal protein L29